MASRYFRVFLVVLESGRVRGTTAFVAPSHGGFQVDEQGRRRERGAGVVKRATVFLFVAFGLLFDAALRAAMGFLEHAIQYLVGSLCCRGILFVPCILQVGQVTNALAREGGVGDVRRIYFPRSI